MRKYRNKFLAFLASFIFATLFTGPTWSATWDVRKHIPLEDFTIQCHRGAGNLSAENSMEAFDIAWELGTVPEADIRVTKDGVIVSFHDNNFARILPDASEEMKKKGIADLTIDEVKKLDIGRWKGPEHAGQRVATLAEIVDVLKKNPKHRIYMDIKKVDFVQLAEETKGVHPQLILASTKYDEMTRWKELAPSSKTLHWMGGTEKQLAERLDKLEKEKFAGIDQLQIHVNLDKDGKFSPSDDFLRNSGDRLRKYGVLFQTLPWNGSQVSVYTRLLELGCASFATDYPEETVQAVKEFYKAAQ